ncbi:MAG: universal stress protein [Phenylobacterium sp.]|uniref:universal stress protein n=1 Tax=Phenylobacterium sp. TaxID=1871053 RepID=UPI0025FDCE0F|nr:universal stress protein [Phenylobacterium sp.]MCA6224866.1 universal stress protein [Phenylobacterium sp.]MCA6225578.1 universal stress protein [Phenylobacterium sp.]MCA6231680.1 universal stress protein [Phenylobacterium sp.]MCA6234803.1 universal stress protein [Phenylobacterium sp.]MCA6248769.1 universal stress protein [Phenylobacterium sp.]
MTPRSAPPRKFLVIADGSAEFAAALRFACRRARSTGGKVAILRVINPAVFEHWSGVREEIERQARAEAAQEMEAYSPLVLTETGSQPELLFVRADDTRDALRRVISADRDIKILVLAAATGGRGPGPLVASIAREGVRWGGRNLPVTVVPGDLSEAEIDDLA